MSVPDRLPPLPDPFVLRNRAADLRGQELVKLFAQCRSGLAPRLWEWASGPADRREAAPQADSVAPPVIAPGE